MIATWAKETFHLPSAPSQVSISKILKKRIEYESMEEAELASKRPQSVCHPQLEEALVTWILQCQHRRIAVTSELIKQKGRKFACMLGISEDRLNFPTAGSTSFRSVIGSSLSGCTVRPDLPTMMQ